MSEKRLAGVDGLRGIAALCVLAYHLMPYVAGIWPGNAYLAVDFFFMLSGYVMSRTYEVRLSSGLTSAAFLWLRWKRLWPTIFTGSLIGLPWFLAVIGVDGIGDMLVIIANLLLIPTFAFNRSYPLNGPVWSIFFELVANVLHALLLRRMPTRALLLVAALMAVILVIPASQLTLGLIGSTRPTFLFGVPRVLMSYTIGIVLWRLWRDRPSIAVPPTLALLGMPVFFSVVALTGCKAWFLDFLFILILCPLMIAGGLRWTGPVKWASASGALSFPLYAFHAPILASAALLGLDIGWGVALSLASAWLFSNLSKRPWRLPFVIPKATPAA
jgi:peptidoglycan/LPS O-acetylase OafA/YrhL